MKISLLDCTLRDGGYVNNWNFGNSTLLSIFERLISSNIDIIEIGFLDERVTYDNNKSIMPNTEAVEQIYGKINKKDKMIVGMIDYGTCSIENIKPQKDSYLDGIRVIFKEQKMYDALKFCYAIKKLGYKVFAQAVSITSYTDKQLLELIKLVNEVEPYAISIVDTYGLLHQSNLIHIFNIINNNLKPNISIGYHSHNNFQLGYANSIEVLNSNVSRNIIVDGTLYGMGKSAGNCPIELLAMYMNENLNKQYDVNQMLEAIETNILDIYKKTPWGYKIFYYISASNKCHPNYVSFLMDKSTLSIKSINEILKSLEPSKKLLYDQKYIEKLYLEYQNTECNDQIVIEKLTEELHSKHVLILGPGKSIKEQFDIVKEYIEKNNVVVISINYILEDVISNYLFITNSKRYSLMAGSLNDKKIKIIASSNVTEIDGIFDYVVNYSSLIDSNTEIPDNSLIMLLKLLKKIGVSNIALAGFDGYSPSEMNYFKTNMQYDFINEKADYLNNYVNKYLEDAKTYSNIKFVTKTKYLELSRKE